MKNKTVYLSDAEMSMLLYALQGLVDERRRNKRDYRDVLELKCKLTDCLMGKTHETEHRVPTGRCC